ncbi:MAG: hypothetical protein JXR48_11215, partial [Candidatus Delongbacteria bacterium]|nr:hypothetical protein [Candidatus Delongbacteria bacterium]
MDLLLLMILAGIINYFKNLCTYEMLHGNIGWESENMKQVIKILNEDDFVMDKVKNHNPAFGYNTLEGYLEE